MLGAKWIDGDTPAEIIHSNRRAPALLTVHTDVLLPAEVRTIRGIPVTTPARTAFDLGRRLGLTEGVQRIDALMNVTDLKVVDIEEVAGTHPGARNLRQLDKTLRLVDGGSDSPYESLARLLLVRAGFPRPHTQIPVYNACGRVVYRIDMGWPEYLVGVDFEGAHHWLDPRQRERDAERHYVLGELGWIDLRLTSRRLHNRPGVFLERVGAALTRRGCPKTW